MTGKGHSSNAIIMRGLDAIVGQVQNMQADKWPMEGVAYLKGMIWESW